MKAAAFAAFFFTGVFIGYICSNKDPKPSPTPRGYMVSYQAGIPNRMTKVGNVLVGGHPFTEQILNATLNNILADTNVVKGSIVILNAVPVY